MNDKRNILLIGSELGKGGAERSISLLSYYLEQKGYNVWLCILSGKDRTSYYKTCKRIIFVDPPDGKSAFKKISAWLYRLRKIKQIKREHNIDVSLSFLEGPDYVNTLTKGREKIVLSIRGSKMFDKEISGKMGVVRKKILIPFLYKRADEIVCVTQALADELHQYFNISYGKLNVIYNFYETEDILAKADAALTDEEAKIFTKPTIITSGRLHVAKNQDKLVYILRKIKKDIDARVIILGDGDLEEDIITLSHRFGLSACKWHGHYEEADIFLMGYQKNAFKFYKHSTLFTLPSLWEGFPNVLAEALICEKPVVTTDCPTGPREILNIEGLKGEPITEEIRTPVGSILPLPYDENQDVIDKWAKEMLFWLTQPQPLHSEFEQLINRFSMDTTLNKWYDVVDN